MFLESYERLNPKQKKIIDTDESFAIHAGPGSGKTEILALKAIRLLEQVVHPSQNVALITYTNEMAGEMTDRLRTLGNLSFGNLFVGTVHSFCLQQVIVPYANLFTGYPFLFKIIGEFESKDLWQQVAGKQLTQTKNHRLAVLNRNLPEWLDDPLSQICLKYEGILRQRGKLDFDGVALNAYWMLRDHSSLKDALQSKFPWLLIDEYQDLMYPFREMVHLFLQTDMRIVVVGDSNQAIYSQSEEDTIRTLLIRAREISPCRMFEESFDVSYRCPGNLLRIAGSVIGEQRLESKAKTSVAQIEFENHWSSSAKAVQIVKEIQAQLAGQDNFLIAHPENWQISDTRGALAAQTFDGNYYFDIWSMVGSDSPHRLLKYNPLIEWLQDVAYWCVCPITSATPSFLELFDTWQNLRNQYPLSFLDSLTIAYDRIKFFGHLMYLKNITVRNCGEWLDECRAQLDIDSVRKNFEDSEDYQQAIDFLFDQKTRESRKIRGSNIKDFASHRAGCRPHLSLLTVHASKGLTFDHVIVVGINNSSGRWTFPSRYGNEVQHRRLLYTILTRARKSVRFISRTNQLPPLLEQVRQTVQEDNINLDTGVG